MKINSKILVTLILVFNLVAGADAQQFQNEIDAFKKQDSIDFPQKNAILLIGSSSFTKWKDVQNYFPGYPIINRGFGGSILLDEIRYEKDVIFPYHPKQIIIYCGENDVASSDTVTGKIVLERFKILYKDIRVKYPTIPIAYISMKPSILRWAMRDRLIEGNKLIKNYLKTQKHTTFINVWDAMLGADGKPLPDIFIGDHLHMNAKGYAIWQKIIKPVLVK